MDKWNTVRWTWKRAVRRDTRLSDASKLLAVSLCDDFAHNETAFCNPEIGTMGEALGKSDRSIQRALKELSKAGWITIQYARGRGRSSEISFKKGDGFVRWSDAKGVTNLSSKGSEKVTSMVRKGDNRVTPYNEPKIIQREADGQQSEITCPNVSIRPVYETDTEVIADWNDWLKRESLPSVMSMPIRSSDAKGIFFQMPWRYPPKDPDSMSRARSYFLFRIQRAEVRYAAE